MRYALVFLLTLKRFFPTLGLLKKLENFFWDSFWKKQEIEERRADPTAPVLPIRGSERAVFIEAIADCWPFRTVLDVGCGYGQNAHILNDLFPTLRYVGLDIDPTRVSSGNIQLEKNSILSAKLVEGDALDLSSFADGSIDIVLSSAFLLYVAPHDLGRALSEMHRVAAKAVILLEQQGQETTPVEAKNNRPEYWVYDYCKEISNLKLAKETLAIKVGMPRWNLEQWQELACVLISTPLGNQSDEALDV